MIQEIFAIYARSVPVKFIIKLNILVLTHNISIGMPILSWFRDNFDKYFLFAFKMS